MKTKKEMVQAIQMQNAHVAKFYRKMAVAAQKRAAYAANAREYNSQHAKAQKFERMAKVEDQNQKGECK